MKQTNGFFPHELDGLEIQEIIDSKPELHKVIKNKTNPSK